MNQVTEGIKETVENFRLNNDDFKSFLQSEKDKTLRIIDSVDENKKFKLNKYLRGGK